MNAMEVSGTFWGVSEWHCPYRHIYMQISPRGKRGLKEEGLNITSASLYLEKVKCDSFVFLGGMPIRKVVFLLYVWERSQCGCSISGVWHALGLGQGKGGAYILIAKQKLQLNVVLLCGAGSCSPTPPPQSRQPHIYF